MESNKSSADLVQAINTQVHAFVEHLQQQRKIWSESPVLLIISNNVSARLLYQTLSFTANGQLQKWRVAS